jgi:hypothetical protein
MQIRKDGEIIYNSIDNTGSTDDAAMGARTTKGRLDTLDGRFAGYYTKAEVLELLTGVAATLIVAELPETPEANTYYLVGNDGDGYVLHYYDTELEHAIVGSYELDLSSVSPQRATMPTAAAALANKCYQYVGTGENYEFGVWYRCQNVSWYAWLNSANANVYYTLSATPSVHAAIYNTAKERMPAKVVSATETTMVDTTNTSYTRNAVADTSEYMWVPLHTKLSQFVNDGDGTNADNDKFITRVSADDRYVQPSTEATLTSKIIDADLNTIADLTTANLKSGVLQTAIGSGSTDTQLPTAKSVYGYAVPKTSDANKVYGSSNNFGRATSVSSSSTDTQIPTAKAVFNFAVAKTTTADRIYATGSGGAANLMGFSGTYNSTANNQLFTRAGAYNLYTAIRNGVPNMVFCGNFTRNSSQSVSSNTSTRILITGADVYRTNLMGTGNNAIRIDVAGTYLFRFVARLSDTAGATRAWYIGGGNLSTMADDNMGGTWNYTFNRHKAEATYLKYCAKNEMIAPWVYIESNTGTVQYVTVEAFKLNDK